MKKTKTPATMFDTAKREISEAWEQCRKTEKYGLEFGHTIYFWRQKFGAQGKRVKGQGVTPILEELGTPVSSAYFWNRKYRISIGEIEEEAPFDLDEELDKEELEEAAPAAPEFKAPAAGAAKAEPKAAPPKSKAKAKAKANAKYRPSVACKRVDPMTVSEAKHVIDVGFKNLAAKCHPDHGGNNGDMVRLNAARAFLYERIK